MSADWEPGDVAMVKWGGSPPQEDVMIRDAMNAKWLGAFDYIDADDPEIDSARPLVVIDPEDAEQVERLYVAVWRAFHEVPADPVASEDVQDMQAALREYARPTPRIEEPTGLGAVVEDAAGGVWVRAGRIKHGWHKAMGQWAAWSDINAVRVLSEGVTS